MPRGGTTAFERDGFGRVVAVTDPLGQVTRLLYAELDGVDFWTPSGLVRPDGVTVSREAEAGGARIVTVDGEGRRTVRRYGPFGLLEEVASPGGGRLRFAYDHRQRLARVENQLGRQWTFERDAAGRVVRETDFDELTTA